MKMNNNFNSNFMSHALLDGWKVDMSHDYNGNGPVIDSNEDLFPPEESHLHSIDTK